MPTLYVENIPAELYEALRQQATSRRSSIAHEVIRLIEQHIPTPKELARRRQFLKSALRRSAEKPLAAGPFPSTEEMIRRDRER